MVVMVKTLEISFLSPSSRNSSWSFSKVRLLGRGSDPPLSRGIVLCLMKNFVCTGNASCLTVFLVPGPTRPIASILNSVLRFSYERPKERKVGFLVSHEWTICDKHLQ